MLPVVPALLTCRRAEALASPALEGLTARRACPRRQLEVPLSVDDFLGRLAHRPSLHHQCIINMLDKQSLVVYNLSVQSNAPAVVVTPRGRWRKRDDRTPA